MSLSVRSRMARQKLIRRVLPRVNNWKCKGQRMWVILNRVHKASLSSVDFQSSMTFVPWQQSFYGVSFLTSNPLSLCQSTLLDDLTTLEVVTIHITLKCPCFDLCDALNIRGDRKFDMNK